MTPILVCGFPEGSSLGLVAALEWLGQPYRLARVDMLGEMREARYARINPRHETPALVKPDGSRVTETMAIAHWMAARDVERRISFDPGDARADRMWQMAAFMNSSFTAAFIPLWTAMEMAPNPPTQDLLRNQGRDGVLHRHAQLEAMLGDGPFIAGVAPTLADGIFIGVARWAEFHEIDVSPFPRIAGLKRRLEADPAVVFAHAVENGEKPRGGGALEGYVELEELLETA
jgi:glutathione S-transferase